MAKRETILEMLELLFGSGLDYTPKPNNQLPAAWAAVFADISDQAFTQAVHDYLKSETRWPAPARLRELAERIQHNHGRSVFADPSRERMGKLRYLDGEEVEIVYPTGYTGVIRVTSTGWENVTREVRP